MAQPTHSKKGALNWILPAIFAVGSVTLAAAFFESEKVETALTQRALTAAQTVGGDWANIEFNGRDATIAGISSDQQEIDQVLEKVGEIDGVRQLYAQFVELAPAMTPYILTGKIEDGKIEFSGGMPSRKVRQELTTGLDKSNLSDNTQLRSAHPELDAWTPQAMKGIEALAALKKGSFELNGLDLKVSGEASDEDGFLKLLALDADNVVLEVVPPFVASYEWQLQRTEDGAVLRGYLPDVALRETIGTKLERFGSFQDKTSLASGAPLHMEEQLSFAADQLGYLNPGRVIWTSEGLAIEGETTSIDARRNLEQAISTAPDEVKILKVEVLDPLISPYTLKISKAEDGTVTASGYAPSDAARNKLATELNIEPLQGVEIARGAPQNYDVMAEFAQNIMPLLEKGDIEIEDGTISVMGQAADVAAFNQIAALNDNVPEGIKLMADELSPPKVVTYQFAATKSEDDQIQLSGFAPNTALRSKWTQMSNVSGALDLAGGAPETFASDVDLLIAKLSQLSQGRFEFDDGSWNLEGIAKNPENYQELTRADDTLLQSGRLRMNIEPARVDAYQFSANKTAQQAVLEGFVPSEGLEEILGVLGDDVDNKTIVALGEPAGFSQTISVGLQALAQLDEGALALGENGWSFSGTAPDFDTKQSVMTQLSALPGVPEGWQIEINSPPPQIADYEFVIEKKRGKLSLSGFVPSQDLADELGKTDGIDASALSIGLGAPSDFDAHINLGLKSLETLDEGRFSLNGGEWRLDGVTDRFVKKQTLMAELEEENVAQLAGLWSIDIDAPSPVDPYIFAIARDDDKLAFSGYVPEARLKNQLLAEAGKPVDDQLAFGEGAPLDFTERALGALKLADNLHDGEVALTEDGWRVRGRVARETGMEKFAALIAAEPDLFADFNVDIAPPPPTCGEFENRFGERGILRVSGKSAAIKPGQHELIDALLTYALQCDGTQISIEGHSHDQGEARANLVHTVRQADSVVNYLVENGVSPSRLVSVGYGENLPLVPNDSRAGRAINQRIEVKITEIQTGAAEQNGTKTEEAGS